MTVAPQLASAIRLANGLRLVHRPSASSTSTVAVCAGGGSNDDPLGRAGLAHLVEHCTYRSADTAGSRSPSGELTAAGSLFGAMTLTETTEFFTVVEDAALPEVLAIEGARLAAIAPDHGILDAERNAIADEIAARDPRERVIDELWVEHLSTTAPSVHWHDGYGAASELQPVSPADAMSFHTRHYAPENTVIAVESARSSAEVADLVSAAWSAADSSATQRRSADLSDGSGTGTSTGTGTGTTLGAQGGVVLALSTPLSPGSTASTAAHLVLAAHLAFDMIALSVGRHGPLASSIAELALLRVAAPTRTDAERHLRDRLAAVAAAFGDDDHARACRTRAGIGLALMLDSAPARARWTARTEALFGDPDRPLALVDAVATITRDDVTEAAEALGCALRAVSS